MASPPGAFSLTPPNSLNVSDGARPGSQLFLIDGGDATNQRARSIIVTPDIDEIEEFRVAGSNFSAEYGYGTNVVNVSTKSGTNQFHGNAWYFNRNDTFAGRSFFAPSVADLSRHQTGVGIGGPIIRNRTFFFFSYEGQREASGRISIATVPTAKMRGGDLSELPQTIFDPTTSQFNAQGVVTRQPFPGNVIQKGRLDSISQLFLDWVPLPNTAGLVGNFRIQPVAHNDYNHYTGKLDHRLTSKDSLMARWTYRPANFPNSIGPYDGYSKDDYSPGTILKNTEATSGVAAWTRIISPTTNLEVRASYSAPFVDYVNVNIKPGGTDWTAKAGIQGFGPGVSDGFPGFGPSRFHSPEAYISKLKRRTTGPSSARGDRKKGTDRSGWFGLFFARYFTRRLAGNGKYPTPFTTFWPSSLRIQFKYLAISPVSRAGFT